MGSGSATSAYETARAGIFTSPVRRRCGLPKLSPPDCVRVVAYDFEKNWIRYEGGTVPSSESLTHAAIYESDPLISAVIHCHDSGLWATLLDHAPTTSKHVPYGTPEMAYEIIDVRSRTDFRHGRPRRRDCCFW